MLQTTEVAVISNKSVLGWAPDPDFVQIERIRNQYNWPRNAKIFLKQCRFNEGPLSIVTKKNIKLQAIFQNEDNEPKKYESLCSQSDPCLINSLGNMKKKVC